MNIQRRTVEISSERTAALRLERYDWVKVSEDLDSQGCAMLEGAAFLSILAFMLEGRWYCLAGALLMILGILYHMPTVSRVQSWLDEQTRQIEFERQLGGR